MALANGMVLAVGSLLIAIPVVLHLLMQPKPKLLTFPALRFVQQRQQSNRRQLQLRHWILLFLRCLLIAALVLALAGLSTASQHFAAWLTVGGLGLVALLAGGLLIATLIWTRPVNRLLAVLFGILFLLASLIAGGLGMQAAANPSAQILGNRIAPVSAVILIDNSPRMQYQFENQTRLEKARNLARWLMEQLPEDSQVGVALPDGSEPFFSVDLKAAEKRLETITTDFQANSLAQSIGPSLRLLSEGDHERRELYVLTDMTEVAWRNSQTLQSVVEQYPEITIYLIDVGVEDAVNSGIGSIEFSSQVITQTSKLEISAPLELKGQAGGGVATLYLEKPDPTRPYRRDGKTILPDEHITRTQIIDAEQTGRVGLKFSLDARLPPGTHHGWIEYPSGDGLQLDDRRYFTIRMRPPWTVLVAAPAGVEPDNLVETISPFARRETGTHSFECQVIEQHQLTQMRDEDWDPFQAVFLLDPEPVNDATWNRLAGFVQQGGGLAIFLGSHANRNGKIDESFNSPSSKRLLPGLITEVWRGTTILNENGQTAEFLVPNSTTHPVTQQFAKLGSRIQWDQLPVFRHWGLRPFSDEDAGQHEVLFRYSNQMPAVIEKQVGLGSCILMTTPITEPNRPPDRPVWNKLFADLEKCWPAWLLVREIAQHLVAVQPTQLNLLLGETALLDNDAERYPNEYFLFSPQDEDPIKVVADQGELSFKFTDYPGNYRLKGTLDGQPVLRGFSVNLRNRATNLDRVDPEKLDEWFGENRVQLARSRNELEREQGTMRVGREFYPILIMLLAVILALEWLMSNRFYGQQGAARDSTESGVIGKWGRRKVGSPQSVS